MKKEVYDLGILLCLCLISFTTSFIVYGDDYVMVVKFACLFDFILNHKTFLKINHALHAPVKVFTWAMASNFQLFYVIHKLCIEKYHFMLPYNLTLLISFHALYRSTVKCQVLCMLKFR